MNQRASLPCGWRGRFNMPKSKFYRFQESSNSNWKSRPMGEIRGQIRVLYVFLSYTSQFIDGKSAYKSVDTPTLHSKLSSVTMFSSPILIFLFRNRQHLVICQIIYFVLRTRTKNQSNVPKKKLLTSNVGFSFGSFITFNSTMYSYYLKESIYVEMSMRKFP